MKTTKAAFMRFAQDGLRYHGSVKGPIEWVIGACERTPIDPATPRDPVTVRSTTIIRHKPTGDSHLPMSGVREVRRVGDYWLLTSSWTTNVGTQYNTVVYS